jgi:hypothetical protein
MILFLARSALWTAFVASIGLFFLPLALANFTTFRHIAVGFSTLLVHAEIGKLLSAIGIANLLENINTTGDRIVEALDNINAIVHLLTALLIAIGATVAQSVHNVEKRLNRKPWYWLSEVTVEGRITRSARGWMEIVRIQKFLTMCPNKIIHGHTDETYDERGPEIPRANTFEATEIFLGKTGSNELIFDWVYTDGSDRRGYTKLNCRRRYDIGLLKLLAGRSSLLLSGTYTVENGVRGTIACYDSEAGRDSKYEENVRKIGTSQSAC